MSEKKHLKSIDKVKSILERFPSARDNNRFLESLYWCEQLKEEGVDLNTLSAKDFFRMYSDHKFREGSVIDRDSRMVQVECVHLRGQDYYKNRGIKKQEDVIGELGEVKERLRENYEKR